MSARKHRRGDVPHESPFGCQGCGSATEPEAVSHAEDVCVNGHGVAAESDGEHDVGGFASDAGQRLETVEVGRDLTVEPGYQMA